MLVEYNFGRSDFLQVPMRLLGGGRMRKHKMQKIKIDAYGTARFVSNDIVDQLLEKYPGGLNDLTVNCYDASAEDWEQLYQLIGYSVSGYGELSRVSEKSKDRADKKANSLLAEKCQGVDE